MLRLKITNGTYQVTLTLFNVVEKLIGCPVTDYIKLKKKNMYNVFLLLIE